jgi:hypothetical protein
MQAAISTHQASRKLPAAPLTAKVVRDGVVISSDDGVVADIPIEVFNWIAYVGAQRPGIPEQLSDERCEVWATLCAAGMKVCWHATHAHAYECVRVTTDVTNLGGTLVDVFVSHDRSGDLILTDLGTTLQELLPILPERFAFVATRLGVPGLDGGRLWCPVDSNRDLPAQVTEFAKLLASVYNEVIGG